MAPSLLPASPPGAEPRSRFNWERCRFQRIPLICFARPLRPQSLEVWQEELQASAHGAAPGSGVPRPRGHRQGTGPHHGAVSVPSALALPCLGWGVPRNWDPPESVPCPAGVPTSSLAPRQGTHVEVSVSLPSDWGSSLCPQRGRRRRLLRQQRDQRRGIPAALRPGPRQPHPDRHRLAGRAAGQGPPIRPLPCPPGSHRSSILGFVRALGREASSWRDPGVLRCRLSPACSSRAPGAAMPRRAREGDITPQNGAFVAGKGRGRAVPEDESGSNAGG